MKRLKSVITCIFLAVVILSNASCGSGTYRKRFTGVLCGEYYGTFEDAVTAYVENEIDGINGDLYDYVSYEKDDDLTQSEISSIYDDDYDKKKTKGEKGTVTYLSKSDGETYFKSEVYIIEEESGFRYCSVMPSEYTPLNKSYYDYVTDLEEYKNVTVKIDSAALLNSEGNIAKKLIEAVSYYTEEFVYLTISSIDVGSGSQSESFDLWVIKEDDGNEVFKTDGNGGYVKITDDNLPFLGNLIQAANPLTVLRKYDHTVFIYGEGIFYLKEDMKSKYKTEFLQTVFQTDKGEVYAIQTDVEIQNEKIYIVTETANARSGSTTISSITTATFTDFGRTEVEIPEEILNMI